MARSKRGSENENSPPDDGQEGNEVTFKPLGKNDLALIMPTIIEHGKRSYTYDSPAISAELPPFGRVFKRYKPLGALAGVLEILDGELVRMVPLEDVRDAIIAWGRLPSMPGERREVIEILFSSVLDAADAMRQATNWLASFTDEALTELPPAARFKSDPGLCFARLPFDLAEGCQLSAAPTWAEALGRMTNHESFAMRVASLFDPKANRKQALWLYGENDTGKSLLIEEVGRIFGAAFHPSSYKTASGNFWLGTLVGKRVVYINECLPKFVTDEISDFKGLTGDRDHLADRKYQSHLPIRLDAVLFMTANPALELPHDNALHTRIIECHISALPDDLKHAREDEVRSKLKNELRTFLSWAWDLYQLKKFPNGRIPCDGDALRARSEGQDDEACEFFEIHFTKAEGHRTKSVEVRRALESAGKFISNKRYAEWAKAWERRFGVRKERSKTGARLEEYVGMRILSVAEKRLCP